MTDVHEAFERAAEDLIRRLRDGELAGTDSEGSVAEAETLIRDARSRIESAEYASEAHEILARFREQAARL